MGDVYYFGCVGDTGHYLWEPMGGTVPWLICKALFPFPWEYLDGDRFTPGRMERGRWVGDQRQSVCKLSHEGGWTMLGCWDRTVDSRPGSNSTFVARGQFTFDEMLALAREAFPVVVERINARAPMVLL